MNMHHKCTLEHWNPLYKEINYQTHFHSPDIVGANTFWVKYFLNLRKLFTMEFDACVSSNYGVWCHQLRVASRCFKNSTDQQKHVSHLGNLKYFSSHILKNTQTHKINFHNIILFIPIHLMLFQHVININIFYILFILSLKCSVCFMLIIHPFGQ